MADDHTARAAAARTTSAAETGAATSAAAIVLAGGRATRLGGVSKALLRVQGRPVLARVVSSLLDRGRAPVVVVGPADEVAAALDEVDSGRRVLTTIEPDRFGGPAVAVGAGVAALTAAGVAPDALVDVLACDLVQPAALVAALDAVAFDALPVGGRTSAAPDDHDDPAGRIDGVVLDGVALDGVVLIDDAGREQWLASRWRLASLTAALESAAPGDSLRRHLAALAFIRVEAPDGATLDLDTPADLAAAGAVVHVAPGETCG